MGEKFDLSLKEELIEDEKEVMLIGHLNLGTGK
jgi:hypothetical protein